MKAKTLATALVVHCVSMDAAWSETGSYVPWGIGWESVAMCGAILLALAFLGALAGTT